MGKNSSDKDCYAHSSSAVLCGAGCAFLAGLCIVGWTLLVINMPEFNTIEGMIDAEVISPRGFIIATAVVGFATASIAIVGCISARAKSRIGLCVYLSCCVLISAFFFSSIFSTVQFEATVMPVIDRLGEELCNASVHEVFMAELDCYSKKENPGPCGTYCKERVAKIRNMVADSSVEKGECDLLSKLCHSYSYHLVGQGNCQIEAPNATLVSPRTWQQIATWNECAGACNSVIGCAGFTAGGASCTVASEKQPRPSATEARTASWVVMAGLSTTAGQSIAGTDDTLTFECYAKDTPFMIHKFRNACTISIWFFSVAAPLVLLASMCTCSMQYTLTTRLKGKKGAGALFAKMLKPAGGSSKERKFADETEEDDSEDENELQRLKHGSR